MSSDITPGDFVGHGIIYTRKRGGSNVADDYVRKYRFREGVLERGNLDSSIEATARTNPRSSSSLAIIRFGCLCSIASTIDSQFFSKRVPCSRDRVLHSSRDGDVSRICRVKCPEETSFLLHIFD